MLTEPAFTETELALRWNISPKTLQRWRCEGVGPPYIKLSKAVRYPVDDIVAYEQANRQGMPNDDRGAVRRRTATAICTGAKAILPERGLRAHRAYGSLAAAEAALMEAHDETQG